MSDEKLRELERRFRETGSPEDEVAWLRTRARSEEELPWESYSRLHELDVNAAADYLRRRVATGDLSQERLELAYWCATPPPNSEVPWALLARIGTTALLCAATGWLVATTREARCEGAQRSRLAEVVTQLESFLEGRESRPRYPLARASAASQQPTP